MTPECGDDRDSVQHTDAISSNLEKWKHNHLSEFLFLRQEFNSAGEGVQRGTGQLGD